MTTSIPGEANEMALVALILCLIELVIVAFWLWHWLGKRRDSVLWSAIAYAMLVIGAALATICFIISMDIANMTGLIWAPLIVPLAVLGLMVRRVLWAPSSWYAPWRIRR